MDLNRRHKVGLFGTLVIAGLALVNGVGLSLGFGILFLGIAATWALGSRSIEAVARVSARLLLSVLPSILLYVSVMSLLPITIGFALSVTANDPESSRMYEISVGVLLVCFWLRLVLLGNVNAGRQTLALSLIFALATALGAAGVRFPIHPVSSLSLIVLCVPLLMACIGWQWRLWNSAKR